MGLRGPKPKNKIKIEWSPDFAYAIGLITTDGNLSKNGRTIDFTSKDLDQVQNLLKSLKISKKIGLKKSGIGNYSYRVQISDAFFHKYLTEIGLSPAKSLILGPLQIPNEYFFHFLRGCFDGDGSTYSYWDSRWKLSFMFYISFCSASLSFTYWLKLKILELAGLRGHVKSGQSKHSFYQLCYSKYEAERLSVELYKDDLAVSLERKKLKIRESLAMMKHLGQTENRLIMREW